jgi:hypothetical protein
MTDPLVLTVLVTSFALATLVLVTFLIAARADHQATIRGPMADRDELEREIAAKNAKLADLDADLEKRREALEDFAGVQAEADAVQRQLDELQVEWNQQEERRREVLALRQETEDAQGRLAEATRDLTDKKADLERVEGKLAEARRLVAEIDSMTRQQAELEESLEDLRSRTADLKELQARETALNERLPEMERQAARLEGEVENLGSRRDEALAEANDAEKRIGELRNDMIDAATALHARQGEYRQLGDAVTELEDRRSDLVAQATALEARIEQAQATAGSLAGAGSDAEEEKPADPLAELQDLPPVLSELRNRPDHSAETEADALHGVRTRLEALGLTYPNRVVRAFHTAMKVNESTQMAVLAGISGTGKSQLPRRYAEAMGIGFLQVPVQPRWDSPQDLMGFYNYIESRFRPTDMARALYHMDRWNGPEDSRDLQDRMLLILLDEMNLARVEYYFSDFLSRLESRPGRTQAGQEAARKDAEIELDIPVPHGMRTPRIFPGYNVLFAGTMNEDESTQSLSDKVVDRANVLRFAAPRTVSETAAEGEVPAPAALSRRRWQGWLRDVETLGGDLDHAKARLERIVELMRRLHRPIGHRLGRAILGYVANYPEDGHARNIDVPLADQVEMRLLPKLRGVEIDTAQRDLDDLRKYVGEDLGDPELAEAIAESMEASTVTGQFVWRGVARA